MTDVAVARIDQVMGFAIPVEKRTTPRGCCNGLIRKRQNSKCTAWVPWILEPDAPGPASGVGSDDTGLAKIDHHLPQPGIPQECRDAISDVALRDTIQRQRHTGAGKDNGPAADLDLREPSEAGPLSDAIRWWRSFLSVLPVVFGIKIPQRLHRRVECTIRCGMKSLGLDQQIYQLARRGLQRACLVEGGEGRPGTVEAKYGLETFDLGHHNAHQACRFDTIGVVDSDERVGTERRATPTVKVLARHSTVRGENPKRRKTSRGAANPKYAPTPESLRHHAAFSGGSEISKSVILIGPVAFVLSGCFSTIVAPNEAVARHECARIGKVPLKAQIQRSTGWQRYDCVEESAGAKKP